MMSLSVLHAGDGYDYLTRSVASGDRQRGTQSLTDYYAQTGTPPGRWSGAGLKSLAVVRADQVVEFADELKVSGEVTKEQMAYLFGSGMHPNTGQLARAMEAQAGSLFEDAQGVSESISTPKMVGKLGQKFPTFTEGVPVLAAIKKAVTEHEKGSDVPLIGAELKKVEREVALPFYVKAHGRQPESASTIDSWVAHQKRQVRKPVAGYDLTFTPAKSVSVLWALADKDLSSHIAELHRQAVDETLSWIESNVAFTRGGQNGETQLDVEGLIVAQFDHWDTRSGDPNLHTHCAVSNKVRDLNGQWRALDGTAIHKHAVSASEHYNARLTELMEKRLGIEFDAREPAPGRQPVMEIAGVPDELIEEFSARRSAITVRRDELVAAFRRQHGYSPSKDTEYKLLQQATLETREGKQEPRSLDEIRTAAFDRAASVIGEREAAELVATVMGFEPQPAELPEYVARHFGPDETPVVREGTSRPEWVGADRAGRLVVQIVSERRADWSLSHVRARAEAVSTLFHFDTEQDRAEAVEATVVKALSEHSVRIDVEVDQDVPAALRRANGESVLTRHGEVKHTSTEILAAEDRLRRAVAQPVVFNVYDTTVTKTLDELAAKTGRELNAGQAALVRHFCQAGTELAVGTGPAGAGKTTAMNAVVRTWKAAGNDVIALAPSAAAASVLGDEIAADGRTIASLTYPWRGLMEHKGVPAKSLPKGMEIRPGTMLLVDEAAMASTKDLAALQQIARKHGAVVRLLGDPAQLDAVETGGALRMLAAETRAPSLDTVVRFGADTEQAKNSLLLRRGDGNALAMFNQRGWIHAGTTSELLDAVFTDYTRDTEDGRHSLMLAGTNDEVYQLNARAQAWAHEHQMLDVNSAGADLADGHRGVVGDRIVTRRNDRSLRTKGGDRPGSAVLNGDLWTIEGIGADGSIQARHTEHGGSVTIPAEYVERGVQLGYASTIHRAQGMTVDTCRALVSGQIDRAGVYVALTRGRAENHAYVSDSLDLDADIEAHQLDAEPDQKNAMSRLLHAMSRDDHTVAASQQIAQALDHAASETAQREAYLYGHGLLRDAWVNSMIEHQLGPTLYAQATAHTESYQALVAALGRVHDANRPAPTVLDQAIRRGRIDTADDIAAVLGHRIGDRSRVDPVAFPAVPPAHYGRDDELAEWVYRMQQHLSGNDRSVATAPTGTLARKPQHELLGLRGQVAADRQIVHASRAEDARKRDRIMHDRPAETQARQIERARRLVEVIRQVRKIDQQIRSLEGDRYRADQLATHGPRRGRKAARADRDHADAQLTELFEQRTTAAQPLPAENTWPKIETTATQRLDHSPERARHLDAGEIERLDQQIAESDERLDRFDNELAKIDTELARRESLSPEQRSAEGAARRRPAPEFEHPAVSAADSPEQEAEADTSL